MKKFWVLFLAFNCANVTYASNDSNSFDNRTGEPTREAGTMHIVLKNPTITPWTYDLKALTAERSVSGAPETKKITIVMDSFGNSDVRSVAFLIKAFLPSDAQTGQWHPVKRRLFIQLEGADDEVALSVEYYLQLTETTTTDTHAHYKTGINTASGINDVVVRHSVHTCTQATTVRQVFAKLANAATRATAEPEPFVLATETIAGDHVEGSQINYGRRRTTMDAN